MSHTLGDCPNANDHDTFTWYDDKWLNNLKPLQMPAVWSLQHILKNGASLLNCEDFNCTEKYFKCPGSYCIEWRHKCDGRWTCPGGADEDSKECTRESCPAQFKCSDSVTCIAITNICDSYTDCRGGDDEHWCDVTIPACPNKCICSYKTHMDGHSRRCYFSSIWLWINCIVKVIIFIPIIQAVCKLQESS